MARINLIHEPASNGRITMIRDLNRYSHANPNMLADDERSIARDIGIDEHDEFMRAQLHAWFDGFARNLREPPADARFPSDAPPGADDLAA
ncbi:MAG: hypothetical protein M3R64_03750 [Pseudomonadota bacterium]|nr:hypothetical protein [Pseudomonadota bacterium]